MPQLLFLWGYLLLEHNESLRRWLLIQGNTPAQKRERVFPTPGLVNLYHLQALLHLAGAYVYGQRQVCRHICIGSVLVQSWNMYTRIIYVQRRG